MRPIGFEVNTDTELVDPDWELFSELHDRRFSLAISYVKSLVEGDTYDNQVMDLRVGKHGFYTQSKNFPAAFYGDTGQADLSFVSEAKAQEIVWEAMAHYRAGEAQSLTCVYSDASPADVFFGYRFDGPDRYELGTIRPSLPLHMRVMIDASEVSDLIDHQKGVIIYQRSDNGQHVVVKAPGRRNPFPLLDGFSA